MAMTHVVTYLQDAGRQMAKFDAVGIMALIVDVGLFNALRYLDLSHLDLVASTHGADAASAGWLADAPITAKLISATVATLFAYAANRWWTFRNRGGPGRVREVALFFLLIAIASLTAVACLGFSHYVLQLDNPTADNISANVIGLALGTLFRWWSYRRCVFPAAVPVPTPLPTAAPIAEAA